MNMSEIAKLADVGKATVSLALRNDPRLRAETRERIQSIAREMGYRPNALVSNLMAQLRASKDPKYQATLALLNAAGSRDAFANNRTFREWTSGIHARASELGYGIDEFVLDENPLSPDRLARILRARNIRGAVIAGIQENRELSPVWDVLWNELSCVVVGVRPEHPAVHFACNDQFSTAAMAARELDALGYHRPGLVIEDRIETNIDHRFSGGFYTHPVYSAKRIPGWSFEPRKKSAFFAWLEKYKPDVIVCTHPEIRDWLEESGTKAPEDIGLVHLDLIAPFEDWSGMNQNNDLVGKFAIDLLIGQLHRNEAGIPSHAKCMMVESQWVRGATVRDLSVALAKPRKRPGNPRKTR